MTCQHVIHATIAVRLSWTETPNSRDSMPHPKSEAEKNESTIRLTNPCLRYTKMKYCNDFGYKEG